MSGFITLGNKAARRVAGVSRALGRMQKMSTTAAASQTLEPEMECFTLLQRAPVIRGPLKKWEVEFEDLHAQRLGKKSLIEGIPADREYPVPDWSDSLLRGDLSPCAEPVKNEEGKFVYRKEDLYTLTVETNEAEDSEIEWGMHVDDGGSNAEDEQSKEKKLETFVPLHPITDADRAGDVQSLNRRLDKTLYFVVKCNNYNCSPDQWTLPRATREAGEPMLEAAERAVSDLIHPSKRLPFDFVTGAPWAHLVPNSGSSLGFVYRAELMRRTYNLPKSLQSNVLDYAWISIDEFPAYFDLSDPSNQRIQQLLWVGT